MADYYKSCPSCYSSVGLELDHSFGNSHSYTCSDCGAGYEYTEPSLPSYSYSPPSQPSNNSGSTLGSLIGLGILGYGAYKLCKWASSLYKCPYCSTTLKLEEHHIKSGKARCCKCQGTFYT